MKLRLLLLFCVVSVTSYHSVTVKGQGGALAFPGCQGFGCETRHAYRVDSTPEIHYVTNLNDSGAGSLRAALLDTDPRIVIFEVSGWINLSSPIVIVSPDLVVAGETAPSPGIGIRYDEIYCSAQGASDCHDVVIRHMRFRPTQLNGLTGANNRSGFLTYLGAYNIVFDHNSIAWHTAEGIQMFQSGVHDVTYSNNLVAEGLFTDGTFKGSCGTVGPAADLPATIEDVLYFRNVCHLNTKESRNPTAVAQQTEIALVNNYVYGWFGANGAAAMTFGAADANGSCPSWIYAALVGNVFRESSEMIQASYVGSHWDGDSAACDLTTGAIYRFDNIVVGTGLTVHTEDGIDLDVGAPPSQLEGVLSGLTILSASALQSSLMANVGARPDDRDSLDTRVISEINAGTGSFKNTADWGEGSPGTFPTLAENTIDHDAGTHPIPASPHNDDDSDGYTNIEEWIHSYACEVEGGSNCFATAWSLWSVGAGASATADANAQTIAASSIAITQDQLVVVCTANSSDQPASVADGGGNTLTSLQRITSGITSIQLHYHVAPATATRTYTATFGAPTVANTRRIYVLPFTTTGEAPVLEAGTAIGQAAQGTTITSGNMSPTGDQTLMAIACARANGGPVQGNPHEVNEVAAQFTDSIGGVYIWTSVNLSSFTGDLDTDISANTYVIAAAAFESAPEPSGGQSATATATVPRATNRQRGRIR
jgi:hypothetical protein